MPIGTQVAQGSADRSQRKVPNRFRMHCQRTDGREFADSVSCTVKGRLLPIYFPSTGYPAWCHSLHPPLRA